MNQITNTSYRSDKVPNTLRKWFVVHFAVDMVVAIPLLIAPISVLNFFGWPTVDPLATRLVAAALFGIGLESFLGRNAGIETYKNMLNLKIIWSLFAIAGFVLTIIQFPNYNNILAWIGLIVFIFFNIIWLYYRKAIDNI